MAVGWGWVSEISITPCEVREIRYILIHQWSDRQGGGWNRSINRRWIRRLSGRLDICIDSIAICRLIHGSWILDVFAASKTRGCCTCGSPNMQECTVELTAVTENRPSCWVVEISGPRVMSTWSPSRYTVTVEPVDDWATICGIWTVLNLIHTYSTRFWWDAVVLPTYSLEQDYHRNLSHCHYCTRLSSLYTRIYNRSPLTY